MSNSNQVNQVISYETDTGVINLTEKLIISCIGKGKDFTQQEIYNFMMLCQHRKLNPFLGEAHLIKYGPVAQQVVGLPVFQKRLNSHKKNKGFNLGIITIDEKSVIQYREGTFYPSENEKLVGAYCDFIKEGFHKPFRWTVNLNDYMKTITDKVTKAVRPQGQWQTMPAVMITKCAFVAGVRYAYPEEFGGMYSPEELNIDEEQLNIIQETITDEEIKNLKQLSKSSLYSDENSFKILEYLLKKAVDSGFLVNTRIEEIPRTKLDAIKTQLLVIKNKQEKIIKEKIKIEEPKTEEPKTEKIKTEKIKTEKIKIEEPKIEKSKVEEKIKNSKNEESKTKNLDLKEVKNDK